MQSTARVTSVLALAAAARALRPVPSRANPVPAAAPWKDGARALAKSGGKAVAAAGLALSFWPAASFAAEDLEIDEGLAATQAFLSSITLGMLSYARSSFCNARTGRTNLRRDSRAVAASSEQP